MQGLALVDYDNMCEARGTGRRGRTGQRWTQVDFERRTAGLLDAITRVFSVAVPELRELDVRFYGGWTDERGIPSPAAFRLLQVVSALRGRRGGVIVRPSLAFAMCELPGVILRGTVRMRSKNKRQKMVDGMLGCDARFAAAGGQVPVGIVTDDDDLVPAALSARAAGSQRVMWMRPRPAGAGLNDDILLALGLQIRHCEDSANA